MKVASIGWACLTDPILLLHSFRLFPCPPCLMRMKRLMSRQCWNLQKQWIRYVFHRKRCLQSFHLHTAPLSVGFFATSMFLALNLLYPLLCAKYNCTPKVSRDVKDSKEEVATKLCRYFRGFMFTFASGILPIDF